MANKIRIKRRATGGAAGAPASLENAELAFNEQDDVLYYGEGTGGAGGTATAVIAIAGPGAFTTLSTAQTLSGNKTFEGIVIVPTPSANTHAATKAYVDSAVANATVSSEAVQDIVGAQIVTNGVHSGISAAYDDAGDGAIDLSLTNTAVTAASYGSSSSVATFTVDAQGRLTAAANTAISITASQVSDRATNLVTGLTGTANQIAVTNSGVGAVTLSLPNSVTIAENLTVTGDLVVNGATTTLNTETLSVEDKNIILANVVTPTDVTADGAGFTIKGTTDKTLNWVDATDAWTSSEHFNLLSGKVFKINGTTVLSGTNLDNVTVDGGTF